MDEVEAINLLLKYKIPAERLLVARDEDEVVKVCKKLRFPLVMKIYSPDVIHKTDVGGIVTGINNLEEARKAFLTIIRNVKRRMSNARVRGVLMQRMLKGFEVMVGCKTDPQFGRVMLFGTGGLYAEVYKDFAARVLPLTKKDVEELIKETRCYEVLSGFRGKKYDLKDLKNIIFRFQKVVEEEEIVEADLNPIIVSDKYAKVVDARMIKLKLKESD